MSCILSATVTSHTLTSSCTKTTGLYISFGKLSSKSAFGGILYFNTIYTWPKRQSRWIFIYSNADCINVNKLKKCIVTIKFVQITDPRPYLTGIYLHRKLREIVPWRTFKIESHCIPSFVDGNVLSSKVINFWWTKTLLVHIFTFKIWVLFHSLIFQKKKTLNIPVFKAFFDQQQQEQTSPFTTLKSWAGFSGAAPFVSWRIRGPRMNWPLLWSCFWHRTKESITGRLQDTAVSHVLIMSKEQNVSFNLCLHKNTGMTFVEFYEIE